MKINNAETIIDEDKFLEINKSVANAMWKRGEKRLAQPYINRVKIYEKIKNLQTV